jgi:hypothetical protein
MGVGVGPGAAVNDSAGEPTLAPRRRSTLRPSSCPSRKHRELPLMYPSGQPIAYPTTAPWFSSKSLPRLSIAQAIRASLLARATMAMFRCLRRLDRDHHIQRTSRRPLRANPINTKTIPKGAEGTDQTHQGELMTGGGSSAASTMRVTLRRWPSQAVASPARPSHRGLAFSRNRQFAATWDAVGKS